VPSRSARIKSTGSERAKVEIKAIIEFQVIQSGFQG
jgi:hypothetical protein